MALDPPTIPEIAVGLIIAEDGRVLLQQRDEKPGIHEPGRWGLFGGHVDGEESTAAAFLREMQEELGWRPKHFEHYRSIELRLPETTLLSHVFAAHLDVPMHKLTLGEGQGMRLFAIDALPALMATNLPQTITEFAATDAFRRVRKTWDVISATAILVDGRGRFLLQHRDDKPEIANPGLWGSFGGEIEPHETPDAGFLRELREELGWTPRTFELYGASPYTPETGRGADRPNSHLIYVFAAPVDVPTASLRLNEGQGMASFPPEGLPRDTVRAYADLLRRFATTELYESTRQAAV